VCGPWCAGLCRLGFIAPGTARLQGRQLQQLHVPLFPWRSGESNIFFRREVGQDWVVWCFLDGVLASACWWGEGQLLHALGATSTATSSCSSAWSSPCGSGQNRAESCGMVLDAQAASHEAATTAVAVGLCGGRQGVPCTDGAPCARHCPAAGGAWGLRLSFATWRKDAVEGCVSSATRPVGTAAVACNARPVPSHLVMRLKATLNIASRQHRVSRVLPHLASRAGGVAVWHAVMLSCMWVVCVYVGVCLTGT
jgi:hypothetical protein